MPTLPTIIVPARLASTRFPRKLLADTGGMPLILRTAQRLDKEAPEFEKFFAVDGDELGDVLSGTGYNVILTNPDLPSGTDRIAQANEQLNRTEVINVQADEPLVKREHILALAESLQVPGADLATLAVPFAKVEDFLDPNQVKVVLDEQGFALYFSRAPIPFCRDSEAEQYFLGSESYKPLKHMGLYAYTAPFLAAFAGSKQGVLEKFECLEQLRATEQGFKISVSVVSSGSIGVDHPDDLKRIEF